MQHLPVQPVAKRRPSIFAALRSHLTDLELWCLIAIGILISFHS